MALGTPVDRGSAKRFADTSDVVVASFTPSADDLLFAWVAVSNVSAIPSGITGHGTWTQLGTTLTVGSQTWTLWSCRAGASPSASVVTVSCATAGVMTASITSITGSDTTGAITNAYINIDQESGYGTALGSTLSLPSATKTSLHFWGVADVSVITVENTQLSTVTGEYNAHRLTTAYAASGDSTPTATIPVAWNFAGFALEVRELGAAPEPVITDVDTDNDIVEGQQNVAINGTNLNLTTPTSINVRQGATAVAQTDIQVVNSTQLTFDHVRGSLIDGAATVEVVYPTYGLKEFDINLSTIATSTNLEITDTLDDGSQDTTNDAISTGNNDIFMSDDGPKINGFLRFAALAAQNKAKVDLATLSIFVNRISNNGTIRVTGFAVDDVAQLNSGNLPSAQPLTTAVITYNYGDNDNGGFVTKNAYLNLNVTTIVQEIISRAGWATGNDIGFLIEVDTRSSILHYLEIADYTSGVSAERSKLVVDVSPLPTIISVDTDDVFLYDQNDVAAQLVNGDAFVGTVTAALVDAFNSDPQADVTNNTTNVTFDPALLHVPLNEIVNLAISDDNGTYTYPVRVLQPTANGLTVMTNPVISEGTLYKGASHTPLAGSQIEYTELSDVTVFGDGSFQVEAGSTLESFQFREWRVDTRTWSAWFTVSVPLGFTLFASIVQVQGQNFTNAFTPVSPVLLASIPDVSASQGTTGSIELTDYFKGADSFTVSGLPSGTGLVFNGVSRINYTLNAVDTTNRPYDVTVTAINGNPTNTQDVFSVSSFVGVTNVSDIPTLIATQGTAVSYDASQHVSGATIYVLEMLNPSDGVFSSTFYYASGFTINASTGEISGTPNAADATNDPSFRVVASNTTPSSINTNTFETVVSALSNNPVITTIPTISLIHDTAFTVNLAQYVTGATSYALQNLPSGTGISIDASTGVMSGTTTESDYAATPIAMLLVATNTNGSTSAPVAVVISLSGTVPIIDGTVITPTRRTVIVTKSRNARSFTQDPGDRLDYAFDLTDWLGTDDIDVVTVVDGALILDSGVKETKKFMVWVSKGEFSLTQRVTCHVTTTADREIDISFYIAFVDY